MPAWDFIFQNLGMGLEDVMLLCTVLGCLILGVKDVRISLISALILVGGEFILFYELGLNYVKALIVFFIALVLLALSLLISYDKSQRWIV